MFLLKTFPLSLCAMGGWVGWQLGAPDLLMSVIYGILGSTVGMLAGYRLIDRIMGGR